MIRVVLDTNVVISAHLNAGGLENLVFKLAIHRFLELCLSGPILSEYERVLASRKFSFEPVKVKTSLAQIRKASTLVDPPHILSICSDEADNRFLECAEVAGADFLITGNKQHFPQRWKSTSVVNAREFIEFITGGLKR